MQCANINLVATPEGARMFWHRVVLNYVDSNARTDAANALINQFETMFRNSGLPSDAEIFRGGNDNTIIYYFSPEASNIGRDLLSRFSAQPCSDRPDLVGFSKIQI